MEQPLKRTIKIGRAAVGLVGLDLIMARALADNLTADKAIDFIYSAVKERNYIPDSARALYRQSLKREYERLREGREQSREKGLNIEILGPGCVSCNRLNDMIFDILQDLGVAADIMQIHELDEIWRHGVLATPALIINGSVKCAGRLPASSEVREWLEQEINR